MPNKPDTSPQNSARVLREALNALPSTFGPTRLAQSYALADALDALPTPITWEERVKAASVPYRTGRDAYSQPVRKLVASILRAAFPEMAPND